MDKQLEEKLDELQKEYAKKKRKLQKHKRATKAKAHVKQKLLEQQSLSTLHGTEHKKVETDKQVGMSKLWLADETCNRAQPDYLGAEISGSNTDLELCEDSASQILDSSCDMFSLESSYDRKDDITPETKRCSPHDCVEDAKHTDKEIMIKIQQSTNQRRNSLDKSKSNLSTPTSARGKDVKAQAVNDSDALILSRSISGSCLVTDIEHSKNKIPTKDIRHSVSDTCTKPDTRNFVYDTCTQLDIKNSVSDTGTCAQVDIEHSVYDTCTQSDIGYSVTDTCIKIPKKATKDIGHSVSDTKQRSNCDEQVKGLSSVTIHAVYISNEDGSCKDVAPEGVSDSHTARQYNTESSETSSVHSDGIFDTGCLEENILKRRTRKGKRRSTSFSKQRQSARLAELSSQDNSSSSSQSVHGVKSPVHDVEGLAKIKKKVLISSMFQYLVDEVKRKGINEFSIPNKYIKMKYEDTKKSLSVIPLKNKDLAKNICTKSLKLDITNNNKLDPVIQASDSLKLSSNVINETNLKLLEIPKVSDIESERSMNNNNADGADESGEKSPILFESQSLIDTPNLKDDTGSDTSFLKKSVVGVVKDFEMHKNTSANCEEKTLESNKGGVTGSVLNESEEVTGDSKFCFEQTACFQMPEGDQLLAMEAVVVVGCEESSEYVACLCTATIRLYSLQSGSWTSVAIEKHSFTVRKNSFFRMYSWPGHTEASIVLHLTRSDSTSLPHYTYQNSSFKQSKVDKLNSKGVCCCPVFGHQLIVAKWTGHRTHLTRYTHDSSSGQWSPFDLENCANKIVSMATIQQIQAAIAGFTSQGTLHIWNHDCGFLLSTVDLSDVCPRDFICPTLFQEEGYLFLPLLSKKRCQEAGSIIIVNPQMGTSETLTSIQAGDQDWSGCSKTTILHEDTLVTMETQGRFSILDLFTGHLLATVDDMGTSCFTTVKDTIFLAHKQCVHVLTDQS